MAAAARQAADPEDARPRRRPPYLARRRAPSPVHPLHHRRRAGRRCLPRCRCPRDARPRRHGRPRREPRAPHRAVRLLLARCSRPQGRRGQVRRPAPWVVPTRALSPRSQQVVVGRPLAGRVPFAPPPCVPPLGGPLPRGRRPLAAPHPAARPLCGRALVESLLDEPLPRGLPLAAPPPAAPPLCERHLAGRLLDGLLPHGRRLPPRLLLPRRLFASDILAGRLLDGLLPHGPPPARRLLPGSRPARAASCSRSAACRASSSRTAA